MNNKDKTFRLTKHGYSYVIAKKDGTFRPLTETAIRAVSNSIANDGQAVVYVSGLSRAQAGQVLVAFKAYSDKPTSMHQIIKAKKGQPSIIGYKIIIGDAND